MATESIHTEGVRHEVRDANVPALAALGAAIVLTIAATILFCWLLFRIYAYEMPMGAPATPYTSSRQLPPEPRLEPAPQLDLDEYLSAQRKGLNSYGWVDQKKGIVRIPIARAMQLLLKQGLPARSAPQTVHARRSQGGQITRAARSIAKPTPTQWRIGGAAPAHRRYP